MNYFIFGTLNLVQNFELLLLVHFNIYELNFELVHVESELSQHCWSGHMQ